MILLIAVQSWTLMKLADETGGGYFEPDKASDLVSTVERIDQELRSQYLLTFRSGSPDGRAHRIRVRMSASTFKVRARRSYLNGPVARQYAARTSAIDSGRLRDPVTRRPPPGQPPGSPSHPRSRLTPTRTNSRSDESVSPSWILVQPIRTLRGNCELSSRNVFFLARSAAVGCTTPFASVTRDTRVCSPGVAPSHR